MEKSIFMQMLHEMPIYNQSIEALKHKKSPVVFHEMGETSKSHVVFGINQDIKGNALVITYNDTQAKKIYEDLTFFLGDRVMYFPTQPVLYYFIDAYSPEISIDRLKVLESLIQGQEKVVVASIESIMKKMIPLDEFKNHWQSFEVGQTIAIEDLQDFLVRGGYERVEEVESPGQYNIRGGILDVYPMVEQHPYRIEFFDDEVDSIRSFDATSQRSIEKHHNVRISPTKELLLSEIVKKQSLERFKTEAYKYMDKLKEKGKNDFAHQVQEKVGEKLEKMHQGQSNNWEFFLSFMEKSFDTLLDYFPENTILFFDQPQRIKERYENIVLELEEDFKGLLETGDVLSNQLDIFFSYRHLTDKMAKRNLCIFQRLLGRSDPFAPQTILSFPSRSMHPFHNKFDLLVEEIKQWRKMDYSIIILASNLDKGKQLAQSLQDYGILAGVQEDFNMDIKAGQVRILPGTLNEGVEYPEIKVAIINEQEIFSKIQKSKKRSGKKQKRKIDPFVDLHIGDFVVHEEYGIGKYLGLEKIEVEGIQKDYLNIKYAKGDKLYIPTDQMHLIQPYIGAESKAPKLNKLGGNEWKRTKGKVKKAIEDMTEELLELYAQRQAMKGYSFSKDTTWQKQFEDGFPYEETQDQLQAIEEVKKDMESTLAMDRLLCGDVGYGKTEVAIRAAFKAVMDGKQVAFLVPTTILAQQHYDNIAKRFAKYPISVGLLNRFRSKAQQEQTLKDIRTGMVDVVVGTHRIVQKDIQFKDIGLLIIDEEQRFGVAHKEKLKEWKKNVDVLTLSATPIPRTLHMSLVGIRDMSVIEEPPEERYPVQTYVMEHNESLLKDAIVKEMDRGGQVYYVHNRVEDIEKTAYNLKNMVPEARIAIGHGQMSDQELEKTMLAFIEGEYDVLVCTTIIETGLDMQNVNTIIITNADRMGLSQLYQLRGRVGRSNRLAYAYITYEKDKVLTEVAEKRLQAIKEFTEFGSGFKVAMRDLEIRGTGSLLGAQQHGHMATIGYDLYCKLLEEAVNKTKGMPEKTVKETTIEINVDAFIPKWYISKESQRIQIYKKMVTIESMEDLYDVQEEIEDRFGDIPVSVNNLLLTSYIKSLAQSLKIYNVKQKMSQIFLYMDKDDFIHMDIIGQLVKEYGRNIMINASDQPYIALKLPRLIDKQIYKIKEILEKIKVLQVN